MSASVTVRVIDTWWPTAGSEAISSSVPARSLPKWGERVEMP
jgi:hypothetical protein